MILDARGLRCPWPAVRLARALRGGETSVEILADDPNAAAEIAAVAAAAGATVTMLEACRFAVAVNAPFTRSA